SGSRGEYVDDLNLNYCVSLALIQVNNQRQ
ncbi:MAG: hypothetical protein ACI8UP_004113, partial [Porticoccaceae bacterium]